MKNNHEYVAGIAVRNPQDFTPKEVYAEIDRQAKHTRRVGYVLNALRIFVFLLWMTWFGVFISAAYMLFSKR